MLIIHHFDKSLRKCNESKEHLKSHNPDVTVTGMLGAISVHGDTHNLTYMVMEDAIPYASVPLSTSSHVSRYRAT